MNESVHIKRPIPKKSLCVVFVILLFWIVGLPLVYNLYWIYYTPLGKQYRTVGAEVDYLERDKQRRGKVTQSDIDFFQSRSIITLRVSVERIPQVRVDANGNMEAGGGFTGTVDPYFSKPGASR